MAEEEKRGGEEEGGERESSDKKSRKTPTSRNTYIHCTYVFNWVANVAHHITLTEVFPECVADSLPVSLPVHLAGQHSTVCPPALSLPQQQQLSAARSWPTLQTQLPVGYTVD